MTVAADPTLAALLSAHDITVERREVREDSAGGQAVRWVTAGRFRGRISQPAVSQPVEVRVALAAESAVPYYVYVPLDADVARGDVLAGEGLRLLVTSIIRWSVHVCWRAECTEYQEEIPSHAPVVG